MIILLVSSGIVCAVTAGMFRTVIGEILRISSVDLLRIFFGGI